MSDDSINITDAIKQALSMYAGEPCRICGKVITREQVKDAVFAGYSIGNKSRAAHRDCWKSNVPKSRWVYSIDDN